MNRHLYLKLDTGYWILDGSVPIVSIVSIVPKINIEQGTPIYE
jgi:hypothetical protein